MWAQGLGSWLAGVKMQTLGHTDSERKGSVCVDEEVETSLYHPLPRLEYDAYRTDLEELSLGPRDAGTRGRLESAQATFQTHRDKYEKLRGDVAIKLKFLEENKVLPYSLGPKSPKSQVKVPVCSEPPDCLVGSYPWLGSGLFP